jgi:hypothetical protein
VHRLAGKRTKKNKPVNEPALPRSFPFLTFFAKRGRERGMMGARVVLIIIVLDTDTEETRKEQ